jgi:hypothetical protein
MWQFTRDRWSPIPVFDSTKSLYYVLVFNLLSLVDVQAHNTLFVHALLFQRVESLVCLRAMFETIYIQMPEINHVILIIMPGMEFGKL